MKFKIITLGCKVNTYESEIMKEKLLAVGYTETLEENMADIIVINTCSVTNMADNKSKKIARHIRRVNPKALLVVCGCMVQNNHKNLDLDADILLGNKDKSKIADLVEAYLKNRQRITKFYDTLKLPFENMAVNKFTSHTRAFIKVQDGCNNFCSYCVIPFLRGNIRSKDFNEVIEEARILSQNGHKEIVLTGIHTGSYGFETDHDLVDLIEEMSKIEKLERIRISSIEITELNDKFIDLLKNNKKVCDHLHIPLQSGSDEVLKAMNRKYNKEFFEHKIKEIRAVRPNISISTDVIVGFPSETKEDFDECYDFCKKINFSKIHVFPYSKRDKTKAALMENIVSDIEKKQRVKTLIELSNELEKNYAQRFIDQKLEVLIETVDEYFSVGHTSNYLKVKIKGKLEANNTYFVLSKFCENECILGVTID